MLKKVLFLSVSLLILFFQNCGSKFRDFESASHNLDGSSTFDLGSTVLDTPSKIGDNYIFGDMLVDADS